MELYYQYKNYYIKWSGEIDPQQRIVSENRSLAPNKSRSFRTAAPNPQLKGLAPKDPVNALLPVRLLRSSRRTTEIHSILPGSEPGRRPPIPVAGAFPSSATGSAPRAQVFRGGQQVRMPPTGRCVSHDRRISIRVTSSFTGSPALPVVRRDHDASRHWSLPAAGRPVRPGAARPSRARSTRHPAPTRQSR